MKKRICNTAALAGFSAILLTYSMTPALAIENGVDISHVRDAGLATMYVYTLDELLSKRLKDARRTGLDSDGLSQCYASHRWEQWLTAECSPPTSSGALCYDNNDCTEYEFCRITERDANQPFGACQAVPVNCEAYELNRLVESQDLSCAHSRLNVSDGRFRGACSGTVVYASNQPSQEESWVLTAGHCFYEGFDIESNISLEPDERYQAPSVRVQVETPFGLESFRADFTDVFLHPDWVADPSWYNTPDIALVRIGEFIPAYGPTGTYERPIFAGSNELLERVDDPLAADQLIPGGRYMGRANNNRRVGIALDPQLQGNTDGYIEVGSCEVDRFEAGDSGGPLLLLDRVRRDSVPQQPPGGICYDSADCAAGEYCNITEPDAYPAFGFCQVVTGSDNLASEFARFGVVAGVVSGPDITSFPTTCDARVDHLFTATSAHSSWMDSVTGGVLEFARDEYFSSADQAGITPPRGTVIVCENDFLKPPCTSVVSGEPSVNQFATASASVGEDVIAFIDGTVPVANGAYAQASRHLLRDDIDFNPTMLNTQIRVVRLSALLAAVL